MNARLTALLLMSCAVVQIAQAEPVASPERPTRLDGLVAVVGGVAPGPDVITLFRSDVELRGRLGILRARGLAAALGGVPDTVLRASLTELLGEALIAVEATRLNLAPPTALALAEERARLLGPAGQFGSTSELLDALGVGKRELDAWVERRAVVDAFLQANLEGTLEASTAELERAFASEDHPFKGQPLEDVRDDFAAWLSRHRAEQAVERWVQSLMQRTTHRILVNY